MTEILKYHALIKQNYRAKDSEIRIIIISTHWSEIIRAFSEFVDRTTYAIKGFEITIDPETYKPTSIKEQNPLPARLLDRQFSRVYSLDLFTSKDKREKFRIDIFNTLEKIEVMDFVLVYMNYNKDNEIWYPHATAFAFQKLSNEEIILVIEILNKETFLPDLDPDLTEEEYTYYLENEFLIALSKYVENDSFEIGYPEKFDAELSLGNWTTSNIYRHGIFAKDPRYDESLLLNELRGLNGNNLERYFGIAESTQPERIKELINNCQCSLENASPWLQLINMRLNQILIQKEKVRVSLYIYNLKSTLQSIAFSLIKNDIGYMPFYQLTIAYIDNTLIESHIGNLAWNGEITQYSLLNKRKDPFNILTDIYLGLINEEQKLKSANLYFATTKIILKDNNLASKDLVKIEKGTIVADERENLSVFKCFHEGKSKFLLELVSLYKGYSKVSDI